MNIRYRLKPETKILIDHRMVLLIGHIDILSQPGHQFGFKCFRISTVMQADIVVVSKVAPGVKGIQCVERFFTEVGGEKIKMKMRILKEE